MQQWKQTIACKCRVCTAHTLTHIHTRTRTPACTQVLHPWAVAAVLQSPAFRAAAQAKGRGLDSQYVRVLLPLLYEWDSDHWRRQRQQQQQQQQSPAQAPTTARPISTTAASHALALLGAGGLDAISGNRKVRAIAERVEQSRRQQEEEQQQQQQQQPPSAPPSLFADDADA